jgi:hypothetical protein
MLKKGPGSMKPNIEELTTGKVGGSRRKAISTYAKKHKISTGKAKHKLAFIIAKSQLTR